MSRIIPTWSSSPTSSLRRAARESSLSDVLPARSSVAVMQMPSRSHGKVTTRWMRQAVTAGLSSSLTALSRAQSASTAAMKQTLSPTDGLLQQPANPRASDPKVESTFGSDAPLFEERIVRAENRVHFSVRCARVHIVRAESGSTFPHDALSHPSSILRVLRSPHTR